MELNARLLENFIDALDTDEGMERDDYLGTLARLPQFDANTVAERVEACDGFFYLNGGDAWDLRMQYGFQTDFSPTNDL